MRQDESNSSSEDQTAYEGHQHSHASHHSHSTVTHEGPPSRGRAAAVALSSHVADMHSPAHAQKLVREIQEAVALLGGAGAAAARGRGGRGGVGGALFPRAGTPAELGFPAFEPRDLAAERGAAGALWDGGNAPGRLPGFAGAQAAAAAAAAVAGAGPSPTLSLQEFLQRSGAAAERVGGNTPLLDDDFDCALVDAPGQRRMPASCSSAVQPCACVGVASQVPCFLSRRRHSWGPFVNFLGAACVIICPGSLELWWASLALLIYSLPRCCQAFWRTMRRMPLTSPPGCPVWRALRAPARPQRQPLPARAASARPAWAPTWQHFSPRSAPLRCVSSCSLALPDPQAVDWSRSPQQELCMLGVAEARRVV